MSAELAKGRGSPASMSKATITARDAEREVFHVDASP